ncbi:hypothetical protein FACS1894187_13110 [Synergistales bacterium]|nr:hypothetical protein FACS1894187_13110 [Synergistales bacterium]
MNKADAVIAAVLIVFGSSAFFVALGYPAGSRMLPMFYSATLAVLSLLLLVQSVLRPSRRTSGNIDEDSVEPARKVIMAVIFIAGYVALIPVLGFYFSTACFLVSFIVATRAARLSMALAVSAGTTCAIYAFFNILLKLQTPLGILF